eukprot:scaffold3571_cov176-Amphora_coffeaeformis.AAC.3
MSLQQEALATSWGYNTRPTFRVNHSTEQYNTHCTEHRKTDMNSLFSLGTTRILRTKREENTILYNTIPYGFPRYVSKMQLSDCCDRKHGTSTMNQIYHNDTNHNREYGCSRV